MTITIISTAGTALARVTRPTPRVTRSPEARISGRLRAVTATISTQASTQTRPGPYPAMNSVATEVEDTSEYTISVFDGGIIIPAGAEAAVTAADTFGSYPSRRCRGPRVEPIAAAEATAAPETELNSALATTLVWAREPGIRPTITLAASTSRSAMPPVFIRLPARTKNGMASRVKELAPVNIRCEATNTACSVPTTAARAATEGSPMAIPIGAPTPIRTMTPAIRMMLASSAGSMSVLLRPVGGQRLIRLEVLGGGDGRRLLRIGPSEHVLPASGADDVVEREQRDQHAGDRQGQVHLADSDRQAGDRLAPGDRHAAQPAPEQAQQREGQDRQRDQHRSEERRVGKEYSYMRAICHSTDTHR